MSVRSATREDLEHLVNLMNEVVDQHVRHLPYVFKQASREDIVEYLTELLNSPDAWVFVACAGQEVVGYTLMTVDADPGNAFFNPRRLLYIEALAVTAAHRREGHGADLLDAARSVAAEQGLDRIEFETWGFNQQAIDYFSARGFGMQSVRMTGPA
jgi:ribosomal protein S18 acetylase RimI-like enzyme